MQDTDIFRKTEQGVQVMANRGALAPRERSVLILVDGRRPYRELATLPHAEEAVQTLLAQGYIEALAQTAPAAPAAAAVGADEGPPTGPRPTPLAKAQRLAVRRLTDMLGPAAEEMCIRLEKTRSPQEFLAAVRRIEAPLRDAVGAQQAARFVQEVESLQPT